MEDAADRNEDLFALPRPKNRHHEWAVIGGYEDDLAIAHGFLEVAELAARKWIEDGPHDGLPVPILYNYRHGIELTLKWLIRLVARCLQRDGYTKENLSAASLDEKLRTHNIKKLADRLDRYLGLLQIDAPDNRIDSASRALLDWLDSEDETGETFRYARIGHAGASRPARPTQEHVHFYEQVSEVHKIAYTLYAGYTGYLENIEQMQIDYYDEMASWGP